VSSTLAEHGSEYPGSLQVVGDDILTQEVQFVIDNYIVSSPIRRNQDIWSGSPNGVQRVVDDQCAENLEVHLSGSRLGGWSGEVVPFYNYFNPVLFDCSDSFPPSTCILEDFSDLEGEMRRLLPDL
jgi:hypothetical protein